MKNIDDLLSFDLKIIGEKTLREIMLILGNYGYVVSMTKSMNGDEEIDVILIEGRTSSPSPTIKKGSHKK